VAEQEEVKQAAEQAVEQAVVALEESVAIVCSISDPVQRLQATSRMANELKAAGMMMAEERASTMEGLNQEGLAYDQLAEIAGVTKPRVQQILGKVNRPSRLGKLEHEYAVKAAELRGRGMEGLSIAVQLVPEIRNSPGGKRLTRKKIAKILGCDLEDVVLMDKD